MNKQHNCKIINKESLLSDIITFSIDASEIAKQATPGQFLEIKCSEGIDPLLRRPISISNVDKKSGMLQFIIQIRGKATELLSKKSVGDSLDILGPLGHGFSLAESGKRTAVIGGGIGVFPLLYLTKELKDKCEVNVYLGFRNKNFVVLEEEFKKFSNNVCITTDDGTYGQKGYAANFLEQDIKLGKIDKIYACGPYPMLKALSNIAITHNIDCEISVEERMCCGIGACLGCACKVKDGDDWRYGHVCKDGPVFDAKKVILE